VQHWHYQQQQAAAYHHQQMQHWHYMQWHAQQQHQQQAQAAQQKHEDEQRMKRKQEDEKREQRRRRDEDQRRKDAEERKRRQVEERAREAEETKRRGEATSAIMKVIQKIRVATPENFDELKVELEGVFERELPHCGNQKRQMLENKDKGLESARNCIEKILQMREAKAAKAPQVIAPPAQLPGTGVTVLPPITMPGLPGIPMLGIPPLVIQPPSEGSTVGGPGFCKAGLPLLAKGAAMAPPVGLQATPPAFGGFGGIPDDTNLAPLPGMLPPALAVATPKASMLIPP